MTIIMGYICATKENLQFIIFKIFSKFGLFSVIWKYEVEIDSNRKKLYYGEFVI